MSRTPSPRTNLQKAAHARARNLRRDIIKALQDATADAGVSRRALCRAAGIGPNTFVAIERDDREPTIEVLSRLAAALGGELSLRFHPGTGPLVRDHLQAAMIEALIGGLDDSWSPEVEVPVWTPSRGSVDVVLRRSAGPIVAGEAQSELRRIEQHIRWSGSKAAALIPQPVDGPATGAERPSVSMLLLLRTSTSNVAVVNQFADTLRSVYPAEHSTALAALRGDAPWPGSAIVWMDVHRGVATFRGAPPRALTRW